MDLCISFDFAKEVAALGFSTLTHLSRIVLLDELVGRFQRSDFLEDIPWYT
jgi:hypothetical protein